MLILVFVIVAIGASAFMMKYNQKLEELQKIGFQLDGPGVVSTGLAPVKGGTANQTQTYTKLTVEYKDRRIQFDMGCQAIPNNVTYKSGTKVMFDNRSGDARIITVGGVKYSFPGYGYKIITLSSQTLPKTLLLSCGAAVNVGQILLQK